MSTAQELLNKGNILFNKANYSAVIEILKQADDQASQEKNPEIQTDAKKLLGICYFEQALKIEKIEQVQLLLKQAIEAFQAALHNTQKIADEQQRIQEQNSSQFWLGNCYYHQALKVEKSKQDELFQQAIIAFQAFFYFAQQITDEQQRIQEQNTAQHCLGSCYLMQALKAKNSEQSKPLFQQAITAFQTSLEFAQQIIDEQQYIQAQNTAQSCLGVCYYTQALRVGKSEQDELFEQAIISFQASFKLAQQIIDEQLRIQEKNTAQNLLGLCYYQQALQSEKFEGYLAYKKERIEKEIDDLGLSPNEKECISDILSVLLIYPYEIENKEIAHYTSPSVVEFLLGIEKKSPMRLNLATYMNDVLEGKALLNYLGINPLNTNTQRAEINGLRAFFTCFSSRVDDLNQFRLYGKVGNIEASGCCLVFNQSNSWLKSTNVVDSFNINKASGKLDVSLAVQNSSDLPLYQVAYLDLNTKDNKGIFLHQVTDETFHKLRKNKLKEALNKLKGQATSPTLLEYLRYLFKDIAFKDEEEFRILQLKELTDEEVKYCPNSNTLYLEYKDIAQDIDEIILGTNFEHATDYKEGKEIKRRKEIFTYLVKQQYENIAVSESRLPINKPA